MDKRLPFLTLEEIITQNKCLSLSDEYETDDNDFYDINSEFNFTLDAAATKENAKCDNYFTVKENGLVESWKGYKVWCNPPYSKEEKACEIGCEKKACKKRGFHLAEDKQGKDHWIRKARREQLLNNVVSCLLLPVCTDTIAFHECIWNEHIHKPYDNIQIRFPKGRMKFSGMGPARFSNMLIVFYEKKIIF